jgi:hypothetical protein
VQGDQDGVSGADDDAIQGGVGGGHAPELGVVDEHDVAEHSFDHS